VIRWVVIAVALLCGLTLAGYDRRTDDTGVEVALLVAASLTLTLAAPRVAIAVALGVALPMAVLNGSFPALVFSGIGAAIGYAMREGTQLSRAG
jgi:ABC-type spermidine/putrescine transport system permease subunit II